MTDGPYLYRKPRPSTPEKWIILTRRILKIAETDKANYHNNPEYRRLIDERAKLPMEEK